MSSLNEGRHKIKVYRWSGGNASASKTHYEGVGEAVTDNATRSRLDS